MTLLVFGGLRNGRNMLDWMQLPSTLANIANSEGLRELQSSAVQRAIVAHLNLREPFTTRGADRVTGLKVNLKNCSLQFSE